MLFFCDSDIKMTDDEFLLIRDLIYNYSGLYFADDNRFLLERRLSPRLSQLHLATFHEYYYYLKYDLNKDQELSDIMDVLTTNETYFFREAFQLRAFSEEIIPEITSNKRVKGDKNLRIWSAGCSTGEEPYTIAMLLLERPELVTFSRLNLYDQSRFLFLGKMDIIFCRNVIIYFDQPAKKRVIEQFYSTLNPGGFLLLGHSESLMNITTAFKLRHLKNDMVYEKPFRNEGGLL